MPLDKFLYVECLVNGSNACIVSLCIGRHLFLEGRLFAPGVPYPSGTDVSNSQQIVLLCTGCLLSLSVFFLVDSQEGIMSTSGNCPVRFCIRKGVY